MANLIEVVFEGVAKNCFTKLLSLLIVNTGKIFDADCIEDISVFEDDILSEKGVEEFLNFYGDVTILVNVGELRLESLVLPVVQIRLLKYEEEYDIDFNFDLNEVKDVSKTVLVTLLYAYVKKLAVNCNVSSFYCGMEPASDEDTRYFTNEEMGPLTID